MSGDPEGVLNDLDRLRSGARGDRRPSSVPLIVFGALTLLGAPLLGEGMLLWRTLYWAVGGPVGFLAIAWWYRHRRVQTGGGAGRGSYAKTGLFLLTSFLLLPLLAVQMPAVAIALLVLALVQRNTYLAAFAVVFGVVGALETFDVLDNLAYRAAFRAGWFQNRDGYFGAAPSVVYGLLGLILVGAGLVALARERRFSRG
jgi:hypothetical protein